MWSALQLDCLRSETTQQDREQRKLPCLCAVHAVYMRPRSCSLIASALQALSRTESKGLSCCALSTLCTRVPPGAQEEVFRRREEGLKKKDLELQASLIRFSKFLQARSMSSSHLPACCTCMHRDISTNPVRYQQQLAESQHTVHDVMHGTWAAHSLIKKVPTLELRLQRLCAWTDARQSRWNHQKRPCTHAHIL